MAHIPLSTVFIALIVSLSVSAQDRIRIAAASDLKFALDSIVSVFEAEQGARVSVTYGSSGKLTEQILNGAPFDIFFSADESFPRKLQQEGLTLGSPQLYGIGRIVLWSTQPPTTMEGLKSDGVRKVAIANPQHAPYGKRAVEAMKHYGIYDDVKPKLVLGENISQAAQFLYSGAADAGIIALSLVLSPPMKKLGGHYLVIPKESHGPLRQSYVVLRNAKGNSHVVAFQQFFLNRRVREILDFYGFSAEELE